VTLLASIADDLAWKYNATYGFAETVTGPAGDVLGIFSNEYYQADAGGSVIASSALPVVRTRDADAMEQGDSVTIRTIAYVVAEAKPDGYGETIHRLQVA
jgi:hypothetical protein